MLYSRTPINVFSLIVHCAFEVASSYHRGRWKYCRLDFYCNWSVISKLCTHSSLSPQLLLTLSLHHLPTELLPPYCPLPICPSIAFLDARQVREPASSSMYVFPFLRFYIFSLLLFVGDCSQERKPRCKAASFTQYSVCI